MFSKLTAKSNTVAMAFVSSEKQNLTNAIRSMFISEDDLRSTVDNSWLNCFFVIDETPTHFSFDLLDLVEYKILHPTYGACFLSFEANSGFEIID